MRVHTILTCYFPLFSELLVLRHCNNNNNNNNNRTNMHTDRCGNTCRQKCCAKGSGKEVKIQEFVIQRMWNLKCTIVPVIIGATGIVTWNLRKNFEALPRKHSIDSLQKTAILGTSHIIGKVLQCEAWSLSGGNHRWFKRSTRKTRPVTRDIHIV